MRIRLVTNVATGEQTRVRFTAAEELARDAEEAAAIARSNEEVAARDAESRKQAALEALVEAALATAKDDPNAPLAVKEYWNKREGG